MVIVVMGVSGSGKTTVGTLLARALGADFQEGDDFHPTRNIIKMKSGIPLTDEDRLPWLEALAGAMDQWRKYGRDVVLSCSALKQAHRQILMGEGEGELRLVHLKGSEALIRRRMEARAEHFMPPDLLESQLAALEEPEDAVTVDIDAAPEAIAAEIQDALGR